MPSGMTKVATTRMMTMTPQQQEEPSISLYGSRRLKLYTPAEIDHCESSESIAKYINAKTIQSKNTAVTYKTRMQSFAQFVYRRYNKTLVDDFLEQIKAGKKYDPYDILTEYSGFLRNEIIPIRRKKEATTVRYRSITL
jgi:hypothetical protein